MLNQQFCESCWAMTATDLVSIVWAQINNQTAELLSTQHACDCSSSACCRGGWPEWVFQFIMANGGVASNADYPYAGAMNSTCGSVSKSKLKAKINGWEKVPARSNTALMKAVAQHPVLVYIAGSSNDFIVRRPSLFLSLSTSLSLSHSHSLTSAGPPFLLPHFVFPPRVPLLQIPPSLLLPPADPHSCQNYSGGIFFGQCSGEIDHAVLVVGYSLVDPSSPVWIVKNTWGPSWGEGGYMRLPMLADGPGKCNMLSERGLYPTFYDKNKGAALCKLPINPCGGGTCVVTNGGARCSCPPGFVERLENDAPKCTLATPCDANPSPCGIGTCYNEFDGSYTCACPAGSVIGSRVEGSMTCVLGTFQSGLQTYTILLGDTCQTVASTFGFTIDFLQTKNPFLDCSQPLTPGYVILVGSTNTTLGCSSMDIVSPGDTCSTLATRNNITVRQLLGINPTLNCNVSLQRSQMLCVAPGALSATSPLIRSCGRVYNVGPQDRCTDIARGFNISLIDFVWLNPGLRCDDNPINNAIAVCVAPLTTEFVTVDCSSWYTVTQADTCSLMANSVGLTVNQFLRLNPGLRCYPPYLQIGQKVCVNGTTQSMTKYPLSPNVIPYSVGVNDTLATISQQYASMCPNNTFPADICSSNSFPDCTDQSITPNQMILIPCTRKIAGDICGDSLPVCGSDYVTYKSACHAVLSFALPLIRSGPCNLCNEGICQNRTAIDPIPNTCPAPPGMCPFPTWPLTPDYFYYCPWMFKSQCECLLYTCDYLCNRTAAYYNSTGRHSSRDLQPHNAGLPVSTDPRQQQVVESQCTETHTDEPDVEYSSQQEVESQPLVRRQSSENSSSSASRTSRTSASKGATSTSGTSDSGTIPSSTGPSCTDGEIAAAAAAAAPDISSNHGKDSISEPAAVYEPESVSFEDRDAKECRICQEEDDVSKLDVPCACSGSLKYAHHDCIQRWCNEKGNTQCEICHHPFKEGYTAPPPPASPPITPGLVALQFRDGAGQLSHIVTFRDAVTGEELRFGLEDFASAPAAPEIPEPATVSCLKSLIIIVLLLIFARHFFALVLEASGDDDDVDEDSAEFTIFLMQLLGILLPCFILARALAAIHDRYRQQEFAEAEAAEAATRLSLLLQSRFNMSASRSRSATGPADVALNLDLSPDTDTSPSSSSSSSSSPASSAASSPASSRPTSPWASRRSLFQGFRGGYFSTLLHHQQRHQEQEQQQALTVPL
ncbi:unnamed protein product [Closterium sp. NIES-54]